MTPQLLHLYCVTPQFLHLYCVRGELFSAFVYMISQGLFSFLVFLSGVGLKMIMCDPLNE